MGDAVAFGQVEGGQPGEVGQIFAHFEFVHSGVPVVHLERNENRTVLVVVV